MVHIHSGILLSHKNVCIESVLMRWMNLETIIQSEVSQKEKNKCRMLMHTYGVLKMVLMDLFSGQEQRVRYIEKTYGHSRGRKGWDGLRE